MPSVMVMAANRLTTDGLSWSRTLLPRNNSSSARQWIILEPRDSVVWLIEQPSPKGAVSVANISERFAVNGALCRTGEAGSRDIVMDDDNDDDDDNNDDNVDDDVARSKPVARMRRNVTTTKRFINLMRGCSHEDIIIDTATEDETQTQQILTYSEDLKKNGSATPFGVIDAKIVLADVNGVQSFEAISGPGALGFRESFRWSESFPNVSHVGQPDVFDFDSVAPLWVWV